MRNDFQQLQALLLINTEEIHAVRVDGERRRVKKNTAILLHLQDSFARASLPPSLAFILPSFLHPFLHLHVVLALPTPSLYSQSQSGKQRVVYGCVYLTSLLTAFKARASASP